MDLTGMDSESSSDSPTEVAAEVAVVTADLSSSTLVSTNPHFITVTGNFILKLWGLYFNWLLLKEKYTYYSCWWRCTSFYFCTIRRDRFIYRPSTATNVSCYNRFVFEIKGNLFGSVFFFLDVHVDMYACL